MELGCWNRHQAPAPPALCPSFTSQTPTAKPGSPKVVARTASCRSPGERKKVHPPEPVLWRREPPTPYLTPSHPAHVHSWLAGKVTSFMPDWGRHLLGGTQMMELGLQIRIQPEKVFIWPNLLGTLEASTGSLCHEVGRSRHSWLSEEQEAGPVTEQGRERGS